MLTRRLEDLENLLIDAGALKANDSRLTDSTSGNGSSVFASRQSVPTSASTHDDEDDWD